MDEDVVQYKDISELKKEFEIRGRRDSSPKELQDSVQKLTGTVASMLDIFSAATEQLKLEEKEYEADSRKHEIIISKLDKLIEQNKTIAEGMVAIVEMVKERMSSQRDQDSMFASREEPLYQQAPPKPFMKPQQPEWQKPEPPVQRTQPMMPPQMAMPYMGPMSPDFGTQMPPMEPAPPPDLPDLNFPADSLGLEGEEPKKKGLFGMFKK